MKPSPIGKRIKELRILSNLSQNELGRLAGLGGTTIHSPGVAITHYENGDREPNYARLKAISKVLKVRIAYFYCEEDALAKIVYDYKS